MSWAKRMGLVATAFAVTAMVIGTVMAFVEGPWWFVLALALDAVPIAVVAIICQEEGV